MTGFGKRIGWMAVLAGTLPGAVSLNGENLHPLAGADEKTPSRSHYVSWTDNTNEGATEKQTLANLEFFKWLHDEYGMDLDMIGKKIDAVVMQFESEGKPKIPLGEFKSEVWITAYPIPYVAKQLVLE